MKWSSAIDTSPLLETAIDQAASQILADLDDQQPDLVIEYLPAKMFGLCIFWEQER